MFMDSRASERVGMLGQISPQSTNTTVNSGWISVAEFDRLLAIISVGVLGSSATVDAKLQQSSNSSGTDAKDITNKAIVQIKQSPTDQSNSQYEIDCMSSEFDAVNKFDYVQLSITVGTASSLVEGLLLGFDPKHTPTTSFDNASVLGVAN